MRQAFDVQSIRAFGKSANNITDLMRSASRRQLDVAELLLTTLDYE
jgi:hypothetical protein